MRCTFRRSAVHRAPEEPSAKGIVVISAVACRWTAVIAAGMCLGMTAAPAGADPDPAATDGVLAAPVAEPVANSTPADPAVVESAPPATSTAPDGWVLIVGAKDETLRNISPLTTALSSRDYEVSGVFNGYLKAPEGAEAEVPHGVLEVGYQIGCGIDMSTSNGVTMTGSVGVTPSLGLLGIDADGPLLDGIAPVLSTPVLGGASVALKPGVINMVPVSKKEFTGTDPWISVSGFHVKIDGCVGESFIRSYAVITRSTPLSDSIQAYYGTTRKV